MKHKVIITIANWAGVNTGDNVMFEALVNLIQRIAKRLQLEVELFVLADNDLSIMKKYRDKYNIIDTIRIFEFYRLGNIFKTINFLTKSDLLIYGGGDLVNGNIPSTTLLILAKIFGLPVILIGVGVVFPTSSIGRLITKLALNLVDEISVRDEKSRQYLERLGITKPKIYNTSDLVFTLNPMFSLKESRANDLINQLNRLKDKKLLVGVNVRPYDQMYSEYCTWNTEKIIRIFANVCDALIETYGAEIVFIPMVTKDKTYPYHMNLLSDDEVGKKIVEIMKHKNKAHIIADYQTLEDLLTLLSTVDILISMRLHPILLASLVNTPSIAIAYAPKVEVFMKELGMSYYTIPINELESKKVLSLVNSLLNEKFNNKIELSIEFLKTKAKLNEKIILKFLNVLKNNKKPHLTTRLFRLFMGVIVALLLMCFNYIMLFIPKVMNILSTKGRK